MEVFLEHTKWATPMDLTKADFLSAQQVLGKVLIIFYRTWPGNILKKEIVIENKN